MPTCTPRRAALQNLQPILDDEIRAIVDKLPHGAQLTFIADCCHSGGMLDHEQVIIDGNRVRGRAMSSHAML